MNTSEIKHVLLMAKDEIQTLRTANHLMSIRLEMFDDVMSALHGRPARKESGGLHPDPLNEIEKVLTILNSEGQPTKAS